MATSRVRQRESFPKLNIVAMKSAMDHLEPAVCVFSVRGRQIGQLFGVNITDECIVVDYVFADEELNSLETEIKLNTSHAPCALDSMRRVFHCPVCQARCWNLYYDEQWACACCLMLNYRSQLVDKTALLHDTRDALRGRIGAGRPKGMHHKTFVKLHDELSKLNERLVGRPRRYASAEHNLIVREEWLPGGQVDLWSSRYQVRSGSIVAIPA